MTKNKEVTKKTVSVLTQYTYQQSKGEEVSSEDLCTQGQAYSIEELIQRFARGESIPIARKVYYDGDNPTEEDIDPTLRPDYDFTDADNDLRDISQRIQEAQRKEAEEEEARKKAQQPDIQGDKPDPTEV